MYIFETTERTNSIATEFETKSMLYLMAMREDSCDMDLFIIDCFNDVTGSCGSIENLWDVQSKGVKNLRPRTIGESLITLFLNFESSFTFKHYILFMPKLKLGYLIEESKTIFDYTNFQISKKDKIPEGMTDEYIRRKKVKPNSKKIQKFLDRVTFVVDNHTCEEYIQNLVEFKNKSSWKDNFYLTIFNELRNRQSSLKNICIDGKSISKQLDVLKFEKIMRKSEIETMIINRFVGMEVFNDKRIPMDFLEEVRGYDGEEVKDIIIDCNASISRTLFNKNMKSAFWRYFEVVIEMIKENPNCKPREIHGMVPDIVFKAVHTMDEISSIYLISLIMGGLPYDH